MPNAATHLSPREPDVPVYLGFVAACIARAPVLVVVVANGLRHGFSVLPEDIDHSGVGAASPM
jgi:hypothetical protein